MKTYVDVILPLPLSGSYTYELPEDWCASVQEGSRVVVQFGAKHYYTAIVIHKHQQPPQERYLVKVVEQVLEPTPILLSSQFALWKWIANYYMCSLGDVFKAALPSGLKIESETVVELNKDFEAGSPLKPKEQKLLDTLLLNPKQSIGQLQKANGLKGDMSLIKSLIEKDALFIHETLRRGYRPKFELFVRLPEEMADEKAVLTTCDVLKRSPKQLHLFMVYLELSGYGAEHSFKEVSRADLLKKANSTGTLLNALLGKHYLELYKKKIIRLGDSSLAVSAPSALNNSQQQAFRSILQQWQQHNVCLLHGVTSSGKTEVYIHLIQQVLETGKQVLYLLPEIALTQQMTERLRKVFGNRMGVYHSKFTDAERVELWEKQMGAEPYQMILGVRSSIFLPFQNLGLVVVDEEHESSYKQQEPAPRYHARNAAIVLASMFNAKVVLGTATPSIESYYNAQQGKYGLVSMTERFQSVLLPAIQVVDIRELKHKKRMCGSFSPQLLDAIKMALSQQEQVILFQNRRGYASVVECANCGWTPRCDHCDVSLTYHRLANELTCHYCGTHYRVPLVCPSCGGKNLVNKGLGTEKIEEEILQFFPEARVARMDMDTTRARNSYEVILSDFQKGETDILIGTQMVTKGLDFDRVSVVGIMNADTMLNYPDFRSYERAFQLMAQVAGRAGRRSQQGLVILQTKSADLPIISQVVHNDYLQLYNSQLEERRLFRYPPFYRLILVYLKGRDESQVEAASQCMGECLRSVFAERVLGPEAPPVARVQSLYIRKLMLKFELSLPFTKVREEIQQAVSHLTAAHELGSVQVYYDVDPM